MKNFHIESSVTTRHFVTIDAKLILFIHFEICMLNKFLINSELH